MTIEVTLPGGKKVDASAHGMVIKTDQPVQAGGEGSAPTPFMLFLASMGTCAGIFVQGFCEQRGIDYTKIKILQHVNVNPATRMVDNIGIEIKLPADFPEKYKKAVINSAELCSVKKHLANPPSFNVTAEIG
jgi:ribosomal protein S12 methylthiotransferase accessory factor